MEAFDSTSGEIQRLSNPECFFGYRDSVFKTPKGKGFIITRVALRLSKNGTPHLGYKDLHERFRTHDSGLKKEDVTLADIRKAVLEIRAKKFPDLARYGTAGSFFKNTIISQEQFAELKKRYPDLPGFPLDADKRGYKKTRINADVRRKNSGHSDVFVDSGRVKLPLAWILDNICGLKGFQRGNVGLFERQPIVLVQNGEASAEEVETFAKEIIKIVKEKTDIDVEWEVQKIGSMN